MWFLILIIVLALVISSFLLNFYKDPKRIIPKGSNILAPADGKVISIIDMSEIAKGKNSRVSTQKKSAISEHDRKSLIFDTSKKIVKIKKGIIGKIKTLTKDVAKECYVISIFMSPLDAHINRAPIAGTIKSIRHTKGKFFKAYDLENSFENEKNEIIIENNKLKVKVIQIAGFLARRIICNAKINQKVNKGNKIGMIALGSQTTLIIPSGVDLKVKVNDKVKAGETIIAFLK